MKSIKWSKYKVWKKIELLAFIKKSNKRRILFLLLTAFILLFGFFFYQKYSTPKVSDPTYYREYISSFTKGTISRTQSVQVEFEKPIRIEDSTQIKKAIRVYPKTDFSIEFGSLNSLVIKPKKLLIPKSKYLISIDLEKIFPKEWKKNQPPFVFSCITKNIEPNIGIEEIKNTENHDELIIIGEIKVSDYLSPDEFQEVINEVLIDSKKVTIEWGEKNKLSKKNSFSLKVIKKDNEQLLTIKYGDQNLKKTYKIPSYKFLSLFEYEIIYDGQKTLKLVFSDAIDLSQDLRGVFLANKKIIKDYLLENNTVHLYMNDITEEEVKLSISKNIRNSRGKKLKSDIELKLVFPDRKPKIEFVGSSNYLPTNKNNLRVHILVRNLSKIDIKIKRIFSNNILQFFQNKNSYMNYSLEHVGEVVSVEKVDLRQYKGLDLKKENIIHLDLDKFISVKKGEIYNISLSAKKSNSLYNCRSDIDYTEIFGYYGNPCSYSFYSELDVNKDVVISNLGITLKKGGNNNGEIIITDITVGKPVSQATVKGYSQNQQLQFVHTTGEEGIIKTNLKKTKFLKAEFDESISYLTIDGNSVLPVSNFNVDGYSLPQGIRGHVYGERGTWRPGDKIYLTFLLNDKDNPLPKKQPIDFKFTDPFGKVHVSKLIAKSPNGFHTITVSTPKSAKTGKWEAHFTVGGASFHKAIPIQALRPNRINIKIPSLKKDYLSTQKFH